MSRAIYLLLIILFLQGCLLSNDFDCSIPFHRSVEAGYFSTSPVPDQTISVGDTVHFDADAYWSYGYQCKEEYGTEPNLATFITNSENVEFYRQEEHVFMIGKTPGRFSAAVVGSAYITKDWDSNLHSVFLPLNIDVISEPISYGRQRVVFPPTGRIDSIEVLSIDPEFPRIRLLTHYSPFLEGMNYMNFGSWLTLTPTLDLEQLQENTFIYDLRIHSGSDNEHVFAPDTLHNLYHGYIEIEAEGRTFGRTFTLDLGDYLE